MEQEFFSDRKWSAQSQFGDDRSKFKVTHIYAFDEQKL